MTFRGVARLRSNEMAAPDTDELASLVAELVRHDSENPPGEEAACARFVRDWLADRGVNAELVTGPDPERPSVGARVGSGDPTVVLNAHLDVVPAGDREEWEYPPYAGERADGRIHGRGSADTKAGLAVAMHAMVAYDDVLSGGDGGDEGTLVFHAPVGEETGDPGTEALLDAGYGGDYAVALEPTDFRVATRAKGLVCYEVSVAGESSHASRPDQGTNAVLEARSVLDAVAAYDAELRAREDDPLVGSAYATVTRFAAGVGGNLGVLPGEASFVLDRRVLPGESVETVEREVTDLLADVERETGVETAFEEVQRYEPATVETDCRLAETLREHSATHRGRVEAPWGIEAATDARVLVNDAGAEAVTWGSGRLTLAHTTRESVAERDVADGYAALADALDDLYRGE